MTWTKSLCLWNENTKIFFTLQVSETKFRFTVSFLCVCIHLCVYFSIFEILHIKLSILLRLSPNVLWNVYSLIFSFVNNASRTLSSTNELFECMTNLRVVLMISEGSRVRVSFGSDF